MTLPRNMDEAIAWFGHLTPTDWDNARLGGITVLALVVVVSLLVGIVGWARR